MLNDILNLNKKGILTIRKCQVFNNEESEMAPFSILDKQTDVL